MPKPTLIGGTYYLRVRVPRDVLKTAKGSTITVHVDNHLREVFVGDTVKVSLRTKDAAVAKRIYGAIHSELETHWEALRNGPQELSHKQSLALAGEIRQVWVDAFDETPGTEETWGRVLALNSRAAHGVFESGFGSLTVPTDATVAEALEERFGDFVDVLLSSHHLIITKGSRKRLLQHVEKAMSEAAHINFMKAGGDYSDGGETDKYPVLEVGPVKKETVSHRRARWTFAGIIDREVEKGEEGKDTSRRRDSTIQKFRKATDEFAASRKSDDVATVTAKELDIWIRELLRAAELGNNTIGQRLQSVSVVIGWGRKQSLGTLFPNGNPAEIVPKPVYQEMPSEERSFTLDEAEAVLRAARRETKLDLRWLPWLAAYSGARINELAQLTPDAFFQVKGRWFFKLTTMGGKELKNSHSERRVPVHPDLIAEGLIEFVEGLGMENSNRIFATRAQGNVAGWVRSTVQLTRKELAPNHGWRHLFEDKALRMKEAAKDYVTGRSSGKSSEGYGKTQAMLLPLAQEMDKVTSYLPDGVNYVDD